MRGRRIESGGQSTSPKQQAAFQEIASKARSDIELARNAIQGLSTGATSAALAAIPSIATIATEQDDNADADKEEEKIQCQLQTVLQSCAASLGLPVPPADEQIDMLDLTGEEENRAKSKRPRSLEPFAKPGAGLASALPDPEQK